MGAAEAAIYSKKKKKKKNTFMGLWSWYWRVEEPTLAAEDDDEPEGTAEVPGEEEEGQAEESYTARISKALTTVTPSGDQLLDIMATTGKITAVVGAVSLSTYLVYRVVARIRSR